MDLNNIDPWNILGKVAALAVAVLAFFGKRHLDEDDRNYEKLASRIAALEADRVVKGDLTRVYDKMDDIQKELRTAHSSILEHLIDLKR